MQSTTASQTLAQLPLSAIRPDPSQPRKSFDQAGLDELAASIAAVGVLEPIVVRPDGETYVLISGERRFRASLQAGTASIPAIVRSDVDAAAAFELAMIENIIRADMTPVEEAQGYAKLQAAGFTVAEISARLGKPAASITARLALLRLAEPIQKLVADGQVDCFVAGHLARLTTEGQYRVVRALNASPMGPLDAARLCSAIAAQESKVELFSDFMQVGSMPEPLAVMPATRRSTDAELAGVVTGIVADLARVQALIADGAELTPAQQSALAAALGSVSKAAAKARAEQTAMAI